MISMLSLVCLLFLVNSQLLHCTKNNFWMIFFSLETKINMCKCLCLMQKKWPVQSIIIHSLNRSALTNLNCVAEKKQQQKYCISTDKHRRETKSNIICGIDRRKRNNKFQ